MKIFNQEISNRIVVLVGVLIIVAIVFAIMSCPKKQVITTIPAINAAQTAMETQFKAQIADRDIQIKDARARLAMSESRYSVLVTKYVNLQKEKDNVKAPVNNAETRDRFTTLGYTPLVGK